jgi:hypothetical protein
VELLMVLLLMLMKKAAMTFHCPLSVGVPAVVHLDVMKRRHWPLQPQLLRQLLQLLELFVVLLISGSFHRSSGSLSRNPVPLQRSFSVSLLAGKSCCGCCCCGRRMIVMTAGVGDAAPVMKI